MGNDWMRFAQLQHIRKRFFCVCAAEMVLLLLSLIAFRPYMHFKCMNIWRHRKSDNKHYFPSLIIAILQTFLSHKNGKRRKVLQIQQKKKWIAKQQRVEREKNQTKQRWWLNEYKSEAMQMEWKDTNNNNNEPDPSTIPFSRISKKQS